MIVNSGLASRVSVGKNIPVAETLYEGTHCNFRNGECVTVSQLGDA